MFKTKAINVKCFFLFSCMIYDIFVKKLASFYIHKLRLFQRNTIHSFREMILITDFTH